MFAKLREQQIWQRTKLHLTEGIAMAKGTKMKAKSPHELKGWQEIASFLGQPISVAHRWAESGMRVERRGRYVYRHGTNSIAGWDAKQPANWFRSQRRKRISARNSSAACRSFASKPRNTIRNAPRNVQAQICAQTCLLTHPGNQHLPAANCEIQNTDENACNG